MKIIKNIQEWRELRKTIQNKSIGFIPTMGSLHEGHLELVKKSKKNNDLTVVSIFVNPTQFNDANDLENYPSDLKKDYSLLEFEDVDYVFTPSKEELYPDNYNYRINEEQLSAKFCGAHRPGHFDGVLTVVMKLLNIVTADKAYFGEKDYQQFLLIKNMAQAFFINTEIVPVKTVREENGLALSSRNQLLSKSEKDLAQNFYKILSTADSAESAKQQLESWANSVDYVEDFEGRRLAALHLNNVRLIDNVEL